MQTSFVRPSFFKRYCAALLCLLIGLSNAFSQTVNTTVSGTIKDPTGAVIVGAKVTLTDTATQLPTHATTNQEGFYLFNEVRSGYYTITVETDGFKKTEVRNVKVDVGSPTSVSVTLETGQIADVITTTASDSQVLINTESAEVSKTIFERQINDLPLNGRNPLQLAGLQAGVATASTTRSATINGMRGSFNNITWDGINIQENYLRGGSNSSLFAQAAPSVVGVSEFTITTQNAGAGDGTGVAQVKMVTPRGSTEYHGSLFEFHRNDVLDANTFFNNSTPGVATPKPKLIRNQFGFGVGGPIKLPQKVFGPLGFDTKKLFFYAYDEETRNTAQIARTRLVLTEPARLGNFSYRRADNQEVATINLLTLSRRQADPRLRQLISLTPLPNVLTGTGDRLNSAGFRFNTPSGGSERLWGFRVDYTLSEKHRFEAIYSNSAVNTPNDAASNDNGEPFPGLLGAGQSPRRNRGSFAWNYAISATLNNEVRGGYYNQQSLFYNNQTFPDGYLLTFPNIGTTGANPMTNPIRNTQRSGRATALRDFADNASWAKGNHFLRFGGNFRHVPVEPFSFTGILPNYTLGFGVANLNPLATSQFAGGISANDFTTASNLLAVLTGAVQQVTQTFNVRDAQSGYVKGAEQRRQLSYNALGFYVGDTWRIRPNFTLSGGARYDYYSPTREANGIGLLPRGGLEALSDPNLIIDLAGSGQGTRPFYQPDRNNFAPNLSFSWDPFKSGKTAIRAGYSLNYVIDSLIQMAENAAIDGMDGLSSQVTDRNINATVSSGLPPVATPAFKIPRTLKDQQTINVNPTVFTIDPKLTTPYVQQWNLSIEREVWRDTVAEVRYVGNRGVKLLRGIDINQVVIFKNGFLDDFRRAQGNLTAAEAENLRQTNAGIPVAQRVAISPAYNAGVPGSQQLTVFPQVGRRGLFTTATGTTLDTNIVNLIRQGQVGELVQTYTNSRNLYLTPGVNGAVLTPGFFLRVNPEAGNVDYVGNGSFSTYHGLQAELRRRFKNGVYFQTNYTYSKAFTDFDGSDANFSALLDVDQGTVLEKKRQANDITHIFKANGIYELPFGQGKRWLNGNRLAELAFGGWQVAGIFEARTGRPISITSNRGTVNRQGRSARNTVITSLSRPQLQERTGLFFAPDTRQPLFFDPSLIGADGRGNPQFLQNPVAGQYGTLQLTPVSGPGFWNVDLSLIKRTKLRERLNLEFRAEAFNAFNHTNFFVSAENNDINSTTFGRLTQTFDPRIMQLSLKLVF